MEAAVVIAIIGVLAALTIASLERSRPRANLIGLTTELHATMGWARNEALGRGRDVAVLFYPTAGRNGTGRILVVADDAAGALAGTFMAGVPSGSDPDFCTLNPGALIGFGNTGSMAKVLAVMDMPRDVALATPTRTAPFPFPWVNVPAPTGGCSFCTGTAPSGTGARGAVRFDSRGRASFYTACGAAGSFPNGGSVALTSGDLAGSRVMAILPTGGVRTFSFE